MDESSNPPADRFSLSPRQRRFRIITVLILVGVIIMIVVGLTHPFFRPVHPPILTPRIARALKVKILIIGLYWISCSLLTASLFLMAWLDLREVRRKLLQARREMWKDILEERQKRLADQSP